MYISPSILSSTTINCRNHALKVITLIIRILPEQVKSNESLFNELHSYISLPEFSNSEKTMLIESIVSISNYFPNQIDFIKAICDPLVGSWNNNAELNNAFSSLESFINYININNIKVINNTQILPSESMDLLYQILSSFYIISKNTLGNENNNSKDLLSTYWPSILPTTFKLIEYFHLLWNPIKQQELKNKNSNYIYLIGYSQKEVLHYLQQDTMNINKVPQDTLLNWMDKMREMLYSIIAACICDNSEYFYSIPNLPNLMIVYIHYYISFI